MICSANLEGGALAEKIDQVNYRLFAGHQVLHSIRKGGDASREKPGRISLPVFSRKATNRKVPAMVLLRNVIDIQLSALK